MNLKKNSILNVRVDNLSHQEILEKIELFLSEPKFHQIATINPEFILEAQKNLEFKKVLNNCDLNITDGLGIKLAFWRYGQKLKTRLAGADLFLKILKIANDRRASIFLACREGGLSSFEETRDAILEIYPNLSVSGDDIELTEAGPLLSRGPASVAILLCSFGAPHQEIFINSIKCDTIRLAMGVGGSFDFLTGKVRRAPKFLRNIGMEWLWRLILQPKRWKRIFNAVVIFPLKIILWKEK